MREKFYGKYRALCRDNNDPRKVGRIRVEAPYPLGLGEWSVWASPALPPGHFDVPEEGAGVWVEFEGGDVNAPIWSGVWWKGDGDTTQAPLQADHPPLVDYAGAEVDADKRDHTSPTDPLDDLEHQEYHDHAGLFYTPHRRTWQSATGHALEWNDDPGFKAYAKLSDRFGRLLEFTATGLTRLRSLLYSAASQEWQDLDGAYVEAAHSLTFQDKDDTGATAEQYVELKDLAGASLKLTSTAGQEAAALQDFWGQHVRLHTVKDAEYIEILDKAGQVIKLDVAAGTVRVADKNGNSILMEDGKITITADGLVTVNGSDKVVVNATDVFLGGEGGAQPLATKSFVQSQYNTHTHLSSAPGTPTGPPIVPSPLAPGDDITDNTKSL